MNGTISLHTNNRNIPYFEFLLDDLRLCLFGSNHHETLSNSIPVKGEVCSKLYGTDNDFKKVGSWRLVNNNLEFHVYGLDNFICKIDTDFNTGYPVYINTPNNSLKELAFKAKVNNPVDDRTELSYYILQKLWD